MPRSTTRPNAGSGPSSSSPEARATAIELAITPPQERPGDIVVTYSELDAYRQCPLKHKWAYVERWGKEPKPGSPLTRGSLWHAVLEDWYLGLKAGSDLDELAIQVTTDHLVDQAGNQDADQELVHWMFRGHRECYGTDPDWQVLAVESAGQLPLADATEEMPAIWLQFKIDALIYEKSTGRIWLVDHKSASNFSREAEIDLDDQFGLYTWALRKMGIPVFGFIRSDARTQRNKGPMTLEQRFRRVPTFRTDAELASIADEAIEVAYAAYRPGASRHSATAPDRCSWRCDFLAAHLMHRKMGRKDEARTLADFGFTQRPNKHREYQTR